MKPVTLISIIAPLCLSLASGCASSIQPSPKAPIEQKAEAAEDEDLDIVVPYFDDGPPGSMDMSFATPAPKAKRKVKPVGQQAHPELVSNKRTKGRLFSLPTTFEH